MSNNFKDHFSDASANYNQFRPTYPRALFDYLCTLPLATNSAWDCATGNGQAAVELSISFSHVVATDASNNQISSAIKKDNINYRVEPAETSSIDSCSVDLVTVAQALHWFDIEKFGTEVLRVLKPHGVLAAWTYHLLHINPALDALINHLCNVTLMDYWPPERRMVDNAYEGIHFPDGLEALETTIIPMYTDWTLDELIGYLNTWSATKRYYKETNIDPVSDIRNEFFDSWGHANDRLKAEWPLTVKTWRKIA